MRMKTHHSNTIHKMITVRLGQIDKGKRAVSSYSRGLYYRITISENLRLLSPCGRFFIETENELEIIVCPFIQLMFIEPGAVLDDAWSWTQVLLRLTSE